MLAEKLISPISTVPSDSSGGSERVRPALLDPRLMGHLLDVLIKYVRTEVHVGFPYSLVCLVSLKSVLK